jgi:hypothetical protein
MKFADHLFMADATRAYEFECRNCGETYRPAVPCSLDMMLAMGRTFGKEHNKCTPGTKRRLPWRQQGPAGSKP